MVVKILVVCMVDVIVANVVDGTTVVVAKVVIRGGIVVTLATGKPNPRSKDALVAVVAAFVVEVDALEVGCPVVEVANVEVEAPVVADLGGPNPISKNGTGVDVIAFVELVVKLAVESNVVKDVVLGANVVAIGSGAGSRKLNPCAKKKIV